MAAFISVPRDLSKVKTKVFMNLTKRQLICFGAGALIGVPLFFVLKSTGNISFAAMGMIVVMMPMFFLAMYEKDGRPLEKILMNIWRAKVQRPGIRVYKTDNFYAAIQQEIYDKEVLGIGEGQASGKARSEAGNKKSVKKRAADGR